MPNAGLVYPTGGRESVGNTRLRGKIEQCLELERRFPGLLVKIAKIFHGPRCERCKKARLLANEVKVQPGVIYAGFTVVKLGK